MIINISKEQVSDKEQDFASTVELFVHVDVYGLSVLSSNGWSVFKHFRCLWIIYFTVISKPGFFYKDCRF